MVLDLGQTGMNRVINVVVGAIIVIVILAAMTPIFFDSVANLVNNLTAANTTTGSDAADAILEAFAPVIGIIAAITFLSLVLVGLRQNR